MGQSVHMPELPRIVEQATPVRQSGIDGERRLSLAVESGRTPRDMALLAQVAGTALAKAGASRTLAKRVADAARIAAHYVMATAVPHGSAWGWSPTPRR
ncbi:hypothetical protein ADK70_17700 [Streptomyces rimosus subsp. pseudoverticillatus]|nr:hypothetical protein ADK70_17700 [Streptomyces rimosus subsp. pseudoverticillatus]